MSQMDFEIGAANADMREISKKVGRDTKLRRDADFGNGQNLPRSDIKEKSGGANEWRVESAKAMRRCRQG